MNSINGWLCIQIIFATGVICRAQTITISINQPGAGQIVHEPLQIGATVASTYEIQSVQASIENRSVALVSAGGSAWTNVLSLAGLSYGTNILTITAADVFGNSNEVQRTVLYDLPPTITVNSPAHESVVRSNLFLSATASDDGPSGATVTVMEALDYSGGGVLAIGTNSVSTNISLADDQVVSLFFKPTDSSGQSSGAFRVVYVEQSTNLVEVARVSDGEIFDVSPDRILFKSTDNGTLPPAFTDSSTRFRILEKSRVDGSETAIWDEAGTNTASMFLTPQGALFVLGDLSPIFYGLYFWQNGSLIRHEVIYPSSSLLVKGEFAAWNGNYAPAQGLRVADLISNNVSIVTNTLSLADFDLAPNGDVVFIMPPDADATHPVFRYRNGTNTLLSSDLSSTNRYPKTDGTNVCYVKMTPTNQVLMLITNGGETPISTGVTIGADLQINNGWLAYSRDGGSGQMQVWRRSPSGATTQLTFFGSSSSVAALAPNGEVAIYNGLHLYISKGTWPPVDIATSPTQLFNFLTPSLKPFWQDGRWYATLGGSLFQIYTGSPQIPKIGLSNGVVQLDIMAASGQRVVTQVSSNQTDWVDLATNNIADGASLKVTDPVPNAPARFYRLQIR